MEPVELTRPKVDEATLVSTPEYCTVLKTLVEVARNSQLRVEPIDTVLDSVMLFDTVPGPGIE